MTDPLVDQLADRAGEVEWSESAESSRLLLCDFLANVASGIASDPAHRRDRSVLGTVAALSGASHAGDRDDIHWEQGIHPGSIVWPVVVSLVAARGDLTPPIVLRGACVGYQVMRDVAGLLGDTGRRYWHATAVAGYAGAAAAAAILLGHRPGTEQFRAALGLAFTSASGVAQTVFEHSPAGRFHRMAAASTGLLAAQQAAYDMRAPAGVLSGERGLLMGLGVDRACATLPSYAEVALDHTAVRLYPGNGFAQAPMLAASLVEFPEGDYVLTVPLSTSMASIAGGAWWDTASLAGEALKRGDPWLRAQPRAWLGTIRLEVGDLPVGTARLRSAGGGDNEFPLIEPPGTPILWREQLETKWMHMGHSPEDLARLATELLAGRSEAAARVW